MDAMELLENVSQAYANLKSLAVEIRSVTESDHDGSSNRAETRSKAWFEPPYKVRIEEGGAHGTIMATDGIEMHFYHGQTKCYSMGPAVPEKYLPGVFQPKYHALAGNLFLFPRIAEQVASVEVLEETPDGIRVAVTYDSPKEDHVFRLSSPVEYWIDPRTKLVVKLKGEMTIRMPGRDTTQTNRHTVFFEHVAVDAPLAPAMFQSVRPTDAVDPPRGSGGGVSASRGDGKGPYEIETTHEWVDGTLIERETLRANGMDLKLERRLKFSEDGRELTVSERIVTPAGETVHEFKARLRGDVN
jgi:hypothetical protein